MPSNMTFPPQSEILKIYHQDKSTLEKARKLLSRDRCVLKSHKNGKFHLTVEGEYEDFQVIVSFDDDTIVPQCNCNSPAETCSHKLASLLFLSDYLEEIKEQPPTGKYSKKEMIKRVLEERRHKAFSENYRLDLAENLHGIHQLYSTSGRKYQVTIRDFKTEEGHCSCPDFRTNKLGTCKHIIHTIEILKKKYKKSFLKKYNNYPFTEIVLDPHYNYNITYYKAKNDHRDVNTLVEEYFPKGSKYIFPRDYNAFLEFLEKTRDIKEILIRPEVTEKIETHFEKEAMAKLQEKSGYDFSKIKGELFDYQKEGVDFSIYKSASIIADEMGLGKTIQAIAVAVIKKDIYDLKKTLVICPASLKSQWKKEIEKFSHEKATIVEGHRSERKEIYKNSKTFFLIANYEAVLRDITTIYKYSPCMIILDEAQRIKNYDTKTSHAVKSIPRKHSLVITGTPLENRLLDLYSIMNFVNPYALAPQWEFSMKHCLFDKTKKNKITGYYDLQKLHNHLSDYIIRREKKEVFAQLPAVQEVAVPVKLHPFQYEMLSGMAQSLMLYINKKHKTFYDIRRIQQILTSMRMTCDSSYLVDKESNYSPKLDELKLILTEKFNLPESKKKIIIFSEWKTMLKQIAQMLRANKIGYTTLSGDVPVKSRGKLLEEFEHSEDCHILLSTEAGGTGLNMQFTDTVINFDLPWNPAKKNQRIGRINRIGQQSQHLTAINMVAIDSIEERIADGIVLKQDLFDAVLNVESVTDEVDFSAKGRSTFIEQLNKLIQPEEEKKVQESDEPVEEITDTDINETIDSEDDIIEANQADDQKSVKQHRDKQDRPASQDMEKMEETLNNGLKFFSGLMKMATGKDVNPEGQSIKVDKETGEVTMTFKLPV
ncbi:MAG: DEAD/DEAH box helicase [Fidelibacterota bacterium]